MGANNVGVIGILLAVELKKDCAPNKPGDNGMALPDGNRNLDSLTLPAELLNWAWSPF